MIINSSFIKNVWISVTLPFTYLYVLCFTFCVTLPFYPQVPTLLTSNSLLGMMIASLASVIQLSLTYTHAPDDARINNRQASYLVSIRLIFVRKSNVQDDDLITFISFPGAKNFFLCKIRKHKYE